MRALKDLLDKKRRRVTNISDKDVFYVFKKVIKEEYGNAGLEKIIPDFFQGQTIFIRGESSVWTAEIFSNRKGLIRKINQELGDEIIKEIKFK